MSFIAIPCVVEQRERECIRLALQLHRQAQLESGARRLRCDWSDFSRLDEAKDMLSWPPGFALWKRLVGLGLYLFCVLLSLIDWPLRVLNSAIRHYWQKLPNPRRASAHLRAPLPENRNLMALWDLHGSAGPGCDPDDERLFCLEPWLDQLYEPGTAARVAFRTRLRELREQQGRGHAAAAARGGCMMFGDAFLSILKQVSGELGSYAVAANVREQLSLIGELKRRGEQHEPPTMF